MEIGLDAIIAGATNVVLLVAWAVKMNRDLANLASNFKDCQAASVLCKQQTREDVNGIHSKLDKLIQEVGVLQGIVERNGRKKEGER